ncbi:MAG: hypothetical protein ABJD07_00605 [Gemmatimonadaceae bacterium]
MSRHTRSFAVLAIVSLAFGAETLSAQRIVRSGRACAIDSDIDDLKAGAAPHRAALQRCLRNDHPRENLAQKQWTGDEQELIGGPHATITVLQNIDLPPTDFDHGHPVARIDVDNGEYPMLNLKQGANYLWMKRAGGGRWIAYMQNDANDDGTGTFVQLAGNRVSFVEHNNQVPSASRWVTRNVASASGSRATFVVGNGIWVRCGSGCCTIDPQ